MLRRFSFAVVILPIVCLLSQLNAGAQAPVALPYTMTTIGGLAPMAATAGTQCPNLPVGVKSTDAYGDGCLAINGIFGAAAYGGTLVDSIGNIYVVDDTSATPVVHKINPATGIMTLVAGGGHAACSGKHSSYGDGCPAATATALVSERSGNLDYYGNILLGGYGSHLVHMICINASPLCVSGTPSPTAANPLQIQIGNMDVVAGCAGNSGGQGTSGIGIENSPGFSYPTYPLSTFQNSSSCSATNLNQGEVDKPEGITGDMYGNIYYTDSAASRWRVVLGPASYNGVTNPLYAVLQKNAAWTTVTAGYVYTISGYPSTAATTKGAGCNGGGTATDGFGDGCLFTSSFSMGVSGYPTGMGVDAAGNMIYTDLDRGLRVFYVSDGTNFAAGTPGYIAGQRMKNAILVNVAGYTGWTSVTAPPTGFNYMLAGGGATAIGSTTVATLGSQLSFASDNKMFKLAVSPQGHIYIGDSNGPARVYFYDINTGYLRTLFVGSANITAGNYCTGTSGPKSLSAYSDGCPASKSLFSNSDSMSVGVDPQGNLYMYDGTEPVIRKVLAQGFSPQTISTPGTSLTQTFQVHLPESATAAVTGATATVTSSPDIVVVSGTNPTTPACSQNGDKTVECTVTVTTTPSAVGQRSAGLTVTLPAGSWQNASATINLSQTETGSVLAVDGTAIGGVNLPITSNAILSGHTPASVALDGAGNLYEATGASILELASGTTYTPSASLPATPSQIAVDPVGNIFAVNSATSTITELKVTAAGVPATYATTAVSYTPASGTAAPQGVAVDQFGNLYVADFQSGGSSVYQLSLSPTTQQYQNQLTVASGLVNPVSLAVDPSGNVFVADKGAGAVYEYSPATASTTSANTYTLTKTLTVNQPVALAVDAAGDVYVQSGTTVTEFPVSGPTTAGVTVLTGLSSPVGLAVDGLGNVYSADSHVTSVTQVVRDAAAANFGTSETTAYTATLTDVGNSVTTSATSLGNVDLIGGSGAACSVTNSILGALTAGQACSISAEMIGAFSSTSSGPMPLASNILQLIPGASTVGSLQFSGTLPLGVVYATTTAVSTPTPSSPVFSASGTEATFTVTVGATVPPTNTVSVTVDTTTTSYPLNASGVATVALTGLKAGSHTISAQYFTNGFYTGSTSGAPQGFSIAQATTAANWTPGSSSQPVSQAIGTGVLNATATTSDTSVSSIAGSFVYTATPSGGSATAIDPSSYLATGTYTLAATFYPADSIDYSPSSTVSGGTYTVAKANTTASVGASTNVVAADGSGNYTSLSAALAALPVTGGAIYLKPGTYTGQNAISYPNVFLRGLGGDPTQVILTGSNGNFTLGAYPQSSGTAFGPGPAGKAGDEGSAVLDVSKNGFMGTTAASGSYSPAGFYAEYLTIQNTYDTDPVTTSTTTASGNGGTCIFTGTTPNTLQYLYNNNLQCGSQAQALFMNADQAILNNVNLISQQDTLYAGYQGTSGSTYVPARQYMWKGLVIGDVDYIYGDAALVLDHTNIFTTWHGITATGTETIEAQNKRVQTGGSGDYLSGYVCNACTLMSQTSTASGGAMTNLYYGRPYGVYSTFVLLNSFVDQVNPKGWVGWDGASEYLNTSTYAEYNTKAYADPAVGTAPYPSILFYPTVGAGGVVPNGGNIGYGVTSSSTPAAARESSALQLTAAQAAQYFPLNFLSTPVSTTGGYSGMPVTWNPVNALASAVNSFASTGTTTTIAAGASVTILGRPQTPGAGLIPTGTYQFLDGGSPLASGTLDASGEAYLTTSTLTAGTHLITMVYSGDSNFAGSTSTAPYIVDVTSGTTTSSTVKITPAANATYGSPTTVTVTVVPGSGSNVPSGTLLFTVDNGAPQSVTLSGGAYTFTLSSLAVGSHSFTALYEGDSNFLGTGATGFSSVSRAVLQVTANNASMIVGGAVPSLTYSITGFVGTDTQASSVTGAPALTTAATGAAVGEYPIAISTGTLAASNYTFSFTGGFLYVTATGQASPVATGDTRTVTEPSFPAICTTLNAAFTSVNDDIPASVDATITNPDGARIQAALNSCSASNPGQAVELSVDGAGHNAYITGPISMPSNVTLLVDPGVYVYFSRNAQDYDKVAGTHTCGTVNSSSATSSCLPLIEVPKTSTNVGIMGYGKLDGRGGDALINAIAPYAGQSWWGLSAIANSGGSQQNPRFIQMDTGSSNITMYKITLRNSPLFHVSTTGAVSGFTAWDVKIVTPTSSRNTDGIDPGNVTNVTIARSWISDGDDNVAVGGSGTTAPASNVSVINNHFFAGHGESIGSNTSAGISNILFDGNMSSGNAYAGFGAASITPSDGNSTGLRIKSDNAAGGLVTGIQYSNTCFLDHKSDIQFTPLYNTNSGTLTPNFNNILLQNLTFVNDASSTTPGTVQFTGAVNGTIVNPLQVTLDNVTFPSTLSSSTFVTTGTAGTETNAQLTYGPGDVSTNFITAWATFAGSNGDTVTNNISASSLLPPACSFTYIAPELTGPTGLPQSLIFGQNATAVVILTPAVGGAAYPTGTITLTDALTSNTTTVTLTGTTDTIMVPLGVLSVGTHTFTATYSGDTNYPLTSGQTVYSTAGPYVITVNSGSLGSTNTALSVVPSSTPYGSSATATATVSGSNPTGSVQFIVSGGGAVGGYVYATAALTAGTASASINLPFTSTAYSVTAVYSGDAANAGSTSSAAALTVTQGLTTTALIANTTTAPLGHPVLLTASVSSLAGIPAGTVNFTYSITSGGTQISLGSATLISGSATASADLPVGTNYVTASFVAGGSFAGSASTPMTITINAPTIVGLPANPIALPYTMTNIAGGSGLAIPSSGNMACTGATDKYGDGCQATAISLTSSDDLRAVAADPFGNVYFSDISATLVRRIAPNGVISDFAGLVSGTACVPTATVGCKPTLVSIGKARGVGTDAAGNIYIANYTGNEVFEVKVSTGLLYLVAGTGTGGSAGDGNASTSAQVNQPRGAWGDALGNIYIADTANNKIRVVDTAGNIHTFAGNGTAGSIGDSGPATSAEISNPQGVITDPNLNVYIADSSGGRIRVVCVTCGTGSPLDSLLAQLGISSPVNGDIYTVAGSGSTAAFTYTAPVLSTGVSMSPQKLAFDNAGNLYISDGNGFIWFLDFHTGYLRAVASNAATVCSSATDTYGDGCPATQAKFGSSGNGMGVGADALGNIYISDTTDGLIRKVITGLQSPSTATATSNPHSVQIHFTAGDNLASTNGLAFTSTEWTLGTPACATNADTTTDCLVTSTFTPAVPGARSTPLTINSSLGNTANLALTGTGLGAGSTLDPASRTTFGSSLQVTGMAIDTAGNVYVSDANSKKLLRFAASAVGQGAGAASTTLATLTAPGPAAVDPRGFVYVGDTSTGLITQISPSGTASTLALTLTTPAGLAVDALNNLYVSDSSAQAVYQLNPITGAVHALAVGTLVAPAGLAIDPSGNLLITDPGAPAIYRFNLQSGVTTTVSSTAVKPSAIATDAAGNLLIADTAAILAKPASANSAAFTVASLAPSALAIDSAGNLYTGSGSAILKLTRTQSYVQFAGALAAPQTVSLLDSGNQALQLTSINQSDTADYSLAAAASTDCTLTGKLPSTVAVGGVCALTASYTPTTFLTTTDTATFNGNLVNATLSTPSTVQLVLTAPATAPTATIALGAFSPASPAFGQTVTATATVSGPSITPAGTVAFTVDGSTISANVVNGVATASLTGLSVGNHTVSAAYTSSNGFTSAATSPVTLTVGQATATVTLSNLSQTYTGSPLSATAATTPTGLAVSLTYNGSATAPTAAGSYTVVATVNTTNYVGTATGTLVIAKATATVTLTNLTQTYNGSPHAATATTAPTGLAVSLTYNGSTTAPTAAGSYTVVATVNDPNYTGTATGTLVISKAGTATASVTSSANPVFALNPITLTATVSSPSGTPTGTVTFLDGTTPLGTGTLASGVATLTTSSLAVGSHSITVAYGGDTNFPAATSGALTQVVEDFAFNFSNGTLTALPGGSAVFNFTVSPLSGTNFPTAIALTISGLPAGATYSFTPASLTAGAGITAVSLTVNVPVTQASAKPATQRPDAQLAGNNGGGADGSLVSRIAPFSLALVLLPFAGRLRRTGKRLGRMMSVLLLLAAGMAAVAGMSACGTANGFFAHQQQTSTVTVTGTSGALSHSATVTLTVE
jgi:sugar lactone lactonase YvrE